MLGVLQAIISGQQPDMRAVHRLHELIVSGDLNGDVSHILVLVRQGYESHNAAAVETWSVSAFLLRLFRPGDAALDCPDLQSLLLCSPDVIYIISSLSVSLSLVSLLLMSTQ